MAGSKAWPFGLPSSSSPALVSQSVGWLVGWLQFSTTARLNSFHAPCVRDTLDGVVWFVIDLPHHASTSLYVLSACPHRNVSARLQLPATISRRTASSGSCTLSVKLSLSRFVLREPSFVSPMTFCMQYTHNYISSVFCELLLSHLWSGAVHRCCC